MFENETFEAISERIASRLKQDIDLYEGSLCYEMLAPVALELETIYRGFDTVNNALKITSADRDNLIELAKPYGLTPFEATHAVIEAQFTLSEGYSAEIGQGFQVNGVFYTITSKEDDNKFLLTCNEAGTVGNISYGNLLPTFSMNGFLTASVVRIVIPGEDVEDTEEFRARFITELSSKAYGFNHIQYINTVNEIDGVGDCKIIRCPRGSGSVDVYIISTLYEKASEELVEQVQNTLRPLDTSDLDNCGTGLVDIGHDTIVKTAEEVVVNISFSLTLAEGTEYSQIQEEVKNKLDEYLKELNRSWGDKNHFEELFKHKPEYFYLTAQINRIGSILLDIEGVTDYDNTSILLNGNNENLSLEFNQIFKLGDVTNAN